MYCVFVIQPCRFYHFTVASVFQEWISSIDWGLQLKAAKTIPTRGQALHRPLTPLFPHLWTLLFLDMGYCSTQTPSMRLQWEVCCRQRLARSFLLWLAWAPGEQTMLFFLVSKMAGTDCVLGFSCCHGEWWSTLQRKPPSTSPTTGRMGASTLLLLVFAHAQCPSLLIVGQCSSGSRPWEDLRHQGIWGVSLLWGGWTPKQHHSMVEYVN